MMWLMLALSEPSLDQETEICVRAYGYQPLTLCLAERSFERSDARLNRQWKLTYQHVKSKVGIVAAHKLRKDQHIWLSKLFSECDRIAASTPTTQQGRNFMGCMGKMTDERVIELRAMTGNNNVP